MRFSLFLLSKKRTRYWWSVCGLPCCPCSGIPAIAVAIEGCVNRKVGSSKAVVRGYSTGRKLGQMAAMNVRPEGGGVTVNQMQSGAIGIEPTGNGSVISAIAGIAEQLLCFPPTRD